MTHSVVTMEHINYKYETASVLNNVNVELPQGAFVGLTGPNGGGKTTFIQLLLGLLKPDTGQITIFGQPIESFKDWTRIGFVSQKSNTFNKGFPATVYEVVSMGLTKQAGYFRFLTKQHKTSILTAIEQVNMSAYTHQNIGELSGGQQQRGFMARALVSDPDLLILDEPTVGVDADNVERFYDLLNHLNTTNNLTILLVTHDTEAMAQHATDIIHLNQTVNFYGTPADYHSLSSDDLLRFNGYPVRTRDRDSSDMKGRTP